MTKEEVLDIFNSYEILEGIYNETYNVWGYTFNGNPNVFIYANRFSVSIATDVAFKCKDCSSFNQCDQTKDIEFCKFKEIQYGTMLKSEITDIIDFIIPKYNSLIPVKKKFFMDMKKKQINSDFENE